MKANELRIGNLITIDNKNSHPRIKDVTLSVISIKDVIDYHKRSTYSISAEHVAQEKNSYYESYSQFIKYIKPIPLTEEWLLKFGFSCEEKVSGSITKNEWKVFRFGVLTYNDGQDMWWLNKSHSIAQPKYVHQLQNLYFALTNKELTIK